MKHIRFVESVWLFTVPLLFAGCIPPISHNDTALRVNKCDALVGLERAMHLAKAFKGKLSGDQQATVQRGYSKTNAVKWSNFTEFSERPRRVSAQLG